MTFRPSSAASARNQATATIGGDAYDAGGRAQPGRGIPRDLARDLLEQACVPSVAHRMSCFVQPAAVEQRGRRRPGSAVAVETVCARLGTEGEQLGRSPTAATEPVAATRTSP